MKSESNKVFLDNVTALLKDKGITRNKMISDLNLSVSSFSDWHRRGNIPSVEILKKIADYFNVTVDYLLGNEQKEKPAETLSELDKIILEKFRQLSPDKLKIALAQLDALVALELDNPKK